MGITIDSRSLEGRNNFNTSNIAIEAKKIRRLPNNAPHDQLRINGQAMNNRQRQQMIQEIRNELEEIQREHKEEKKAFNRWCKRVDRFAFAVDEGAKRLDDIEKRLLAYESKLKAENDLKIMNPVMPNNYKEYTITNSLPEDNRTLAEKIAQDTLELRENLEKSLKKADDKIAKIREAREFKESLDRFFHDSSFWERFSFFEKPLWSLKLFLLGL